MTADHAPDHPQDHGQHRTAVAALGVLFGPLQSVSLEQGPTSTVESVFLLGLAAVGAVLTYQAFRGYRRNDDRSMALFGGGLFLLTVGHAALKLSLTYVAPIVTGAGPTLALGVAATSQAVDLIGLVAIFYAILR
jgi:hypothetical protein